MMKHYNVNDVAKRDRHHDTERDNGGGFGDGMSDTKALVHSFSPQDFFS